MKIDRITYAVERKVGLPNYSSATIRAELSASTTDSKTDMPKLIKKVTKLVEDEMEKVIDKYN